jgi:hypothetical protein
MRSPGIPLLGPRVGKGPGWGCFFGRVTAKRTVFRLAAVVEDVRGRGGTRLISVLVEVGVLFLATVVQKWCLLYILSCSAPERLNLTQRRDGGAENLNDRGTIGIWHVCVL